MPTLLADDAEYSDSKGNLYKAWYNIFIHRWQVLIYTKGEAPDGTPTTNVIHTIGYFHEETAAAERAQQLAHRVIQGE